MAEIYVAVSRSLQAWAGDVGLTKHLYKLGVAADDGAEAAVARMAEERCAGRTDWKLVRKQEVEGIDEATALARVGSKEMAIDPTYYPQLKGRHGHLQGQAHQRREPRSRPPGPGRRAAQAHPDQADRLRRLSHPPRRRLTA